jgi:hypothetical protein
MRLLSGLEDSLSLGSSHDVLDEQGSRSFFWRLENRIIIADLE